MDVIVGTSGHIDHGKTALVKALTGTDADRLPEEKQRGITIDLGFAELDLGNSKIGFIDVPGHERFVKNMLAGASGIDFVLLVIASDEGVMPQTREHFEICRLLGIQQGLIVLTKKDLVDEEFLDLVKRDVAELVEDSFLESAPVISVSSKTGDGIEELKRVLADSIPKIPRRKNEFVTRLSIDRVFTVKGFGAVVTGTLANGEVRAGTEMELHPIGKVVRVRGIQTHGEDVGQARAGQRTAINLGGIDHSEIERGMLLAETGTLSPTQIFDAVVEVLSAAKRPLKSRQRVRVHVGSLEALGRIQILNEQREIAPGERDFVQVRLESSVTVVPEERFIMRQYSPQITIAGGRILDAHAAKHKSKDIESARNFFEKLIAAEAEGNRPESLRLLLENQNNVVLDFSELQSRTGWRSEILKTALDEYIDTKRIVRADQFFIARTNFDSLKQKIVGSIEEFHKSEPLAPGILRETLKEYTSAHLPVEVFRKALSVLVDEEKIVAEKEFVRAASHQHELSPDEKLIQQNMIAIYEESGLAAPDIQLVIQESIKGTQVDQMQARKIFQLLLDSQEIEKIADGYFCSKTSIGELVEKLKKYAENETENRLISVAEFKEIAQVSRKYAIPLLEYLDAKKITARAGDKRIIL